MAAERDPAIERQEVVRLLQGMFSEEEEVQVVIQRATEKANREGKGM